MAVDHHHCACGVYLNMVDTELIAHQLRERGHNVTGVTAIPSNAGEYEFHVDGTMLTLEQARELLESESTEKPL